MLFFLRVLGASLLTLGVADVTAQEVRVITDEVSCDSCMIERYRVATIHDREFPEGALATVVFPHLNTDGRFLVVAGPIEDELFQTDLDGSIVRRVGRAGEGPGEYKHPTHVHELPSAYLVYDSRLRRVTRLSKTNLEVLATTRLPVIGGPVRPIVFEDGSYLFAGSSSTRGGVGHFFHLVDSSGDAVRSFGEPDGVLRPRSLEYPMVLALSRDGSFWAGYRGDYRIERWDREGNLLEVFLREANWFSYDPDNDERRATVPQARLTGLFEDEDGLLWVHVTSRRFIPREQGTGLRSDPDPATRGSIIEVLDPKAGTLVASSRVDGWRAFSAIGGFYQVVYPEGPVGPLSVEVWAARLERDFPSLNK
jgi:hypothetical protein